MSRIILNDNQCNQLESLTSDLRSFPERLRQSCANFEQMLNAPVMVQYIQGTAAGASVFDSLKRNIANVERTSDNIARICRANDELISWNRRNNSQQVGS